MVLFSLYCKEKKKKKQKRLKRMLFNQTIQKHCSYRNSTILIVLSDQKAFFWTLSCLLKIFKWLTIISVPNLYLFIYFILFYFHFSVPGSQRQSSLTPGLPDRRGSTSLALGLGSLGAGAGDRRASSLSNGSREPRGGGKLSLIHIWRCRRDVLCRSRWSPYH